MKYDFSKVKDDISARIAKGILPGAIATVSIDGEKVFECVEGYSDVEKRTPLSKRNIFRLASMTKPITAVAALILQDRGVISVKDNISKYLPGFEHMYVGKLTPSGEVITDREADRQITIEDILTHCSGLSSGAVGNAEYPLYGHKDEKSFKETVEGYSKMHLDFTPGSSQMYSPMVALDVVARIVEIASGMPYEKFLIKNLFNPLEMNDTVYSLSDEQWSRAVPMYMLDGDVTKITKTEEECDYKKGFKLFSAGYTGGAAGLWGTSGDYVKFADMLVNKGKSNGVRIISEKAVEKMSAPHYEIGFAGMNEYFNWGYCVRTVHKQTDGVQMLSPGSFGWSGAYNTHFWVDPVLKLTGVFMSNLDNAGGSGSATAFEFECDVMNEIKGKK